MYAFSLLFFCCCYYFSLSIIYNMVSFSACFNFFSLVYFSTFLALANVHLKIDYKIDMKNQRVLGKKHQDLNLDS